MCSSDGQSIFDTLKVVFLIFQLVDRFLRINYFRSAAVFLVSPEKKINFNRHGSASEIWLFGK
jgi:hypothetical protein